MVEVNCLLALVYTAEEAVSPPTIMFPEPPISKAAPGAVVPMPTEPEFKILIASVAPLFPVWKIISAPVVPTPLVERRLRVEVVVVPPMIKGVVI